MGLAWTLPRPTQRLCNRPRSWTRLLALSSHISPHYEGTASQGLSPATTLLPITPLLVPRQLATAVGWSRPRSSSCDAGCHTPHLAAVAATTVIRLDHVPCSPLRHSTPSFPFADQNPQRSCRLPSIDQFFFQRLPFVCLQTLWLSVVWKDDRLNGCFLAKSPERFFGPLAAVLISVEH